jgi:two-component system copper resistance phosphate regulon response regulator CusR
MMLPGIDGLEFLDTLRGRGSNTPVLVLSARDTVDDRVVGLDRGADDYLIKPYDFKELAARVQALIRRSTDHKRPVLDCGPLTLDPIARECRVEGQQVVLRRREFDILELLLRYENQVFTRDRIIAHVWQREYDGTSNVVDVHVKYLRDKLRPFGLDIIVVTVRGVGYKVVCPSRRD